MTMTDAANVQDAIISVRDITVRFGARAVLDGLDLAVGRPQNGWSRGILQEPRM